MKYKITMWAAAIVMSFTLGGVAMSLGPTTSTAAAASCSKSGSFLSFTPWYRGLVKDAGGDDCVVKSPSEVGGLSKFIWTIALNILDDLLRAVGFASVAFIIYGGFKYMTSTGSSDGMSKAKTTILNAIIGLVISVMSVAIVNLVVGSFK